MTMPSKKAAMEFFGSYALPRRGIDISAQDRYYATTGIQKVFYRKILPHEKDRGVSFPLFASNFQAFAPFGIGIGLYFLQLLVLCVACFICGLIFVVALYEYGKSSYGLTQSSSGSAYISITAACEHTIDVNATIGCDHNAEQCTGQYRPQCEFPYKAGAADLAMSMAFILCIIISKFLENFVEEELDEAIQTAKDYSVVCNNPPDEGGSDDPDEWFKFFSNFGTVRYITITRKNYAFQELLACLHLYKLRMEELTESGRITTDIRSKLQKDIKKLEKQVENTYTRTYPVNQVYVTFEYEEHQRHCISELEVPDYETMCVVKNNSMRLTFKGKTLDYMEPPEADSILWGNLEVTRINRDIFGAIGVVFTILILVAVFFIIKAAYSYNPVLLSIVVAIIDIILPPVFIFIVSKVYPESEGINQGEIQVRLSIARLLLSTLFPYVFVSWKHVLDQEYISALFLTLLILCFFSPVIAVFDLNGLVSRHILGPCFAGTQRELNAMYLGSDWSLAEKYTVLSKIMFLSMFYSILNPINMFVAAFAFGIIFLIDRFLILKKLKQACMLSGEIALRLRQQAILCVALHMVVSLRHIYSWPMDTVWKHTDDDGTYEIVDKFAPIAFWRMTTKDWMSSGQHHILQPYKIATIIVVIITIYIWIIQPILTSLHSLFFLESNEVGQSQGIPFSSVDEIPIYIPIVKHKEQLFICACTKDVKDNHYLSLLHPLPGDKDNISYLVREDMQQHLLAVVKYYGDFKSSDIESAGGIVPQRTEISVDESKHGATTESMVLNTLETAPQFSLYGKSIIDNLPKYSTTDENILHPVMTTIPAALDSKMQEKKIPNKSKRIRRAREIETNGYVPVNHNPFLPSYNQNNIINASNRRIHPSPAVATTISSPSDLQPTSPLSPVRKRGNRIILKPLKPQIS